MNPSFWDADHGTVASQLPGVQLVHGGTDAIILATKGYPRSDNASGIYQPILQMPPGAVYCPRHRNAILTLIVTRDGGCVLIKAVESGGQAVDGPGKVSEALGLTEARSRGFAEYRSGQTTSVVLTIDGRPPPRTLPVRPQVLAPVGITREVLGRLSKRICLAYLRHDPGISYEEFLQRLLQRCTDEKTLRQALDE